MGKIDVEIDDFLIWVFGGQKEDETNMLFILCLLVLAALIGFLLLVCVRRDRVGGSVLPFRLCLLMLLFSVFLLQVYFIVKTNEQFFQKDINF